MRWDLRLIVLICWCNYNASTFLSVTLRPWVLVRPELNSRPPAWQPDAQPTELLVAVDWATGLHSDKFTSILWHLDSLQGKNWILSNMFFKFLSLSKGNSFFIILWELRPQEKGAVCGLTLHLFWISLILIIITTLLALPCIIFKTVWESVFFS